ncbi:MAG: glycosyltransferase family 39 protein [bacterium]
MFSKLTRQESSPPPSLGKRLWVVFAVALAVRVACVVWIPPTPQSAFGPLDDATDYDHLARTLLSNGAFLSPSGEPTAFRPPVYPIFLAIIYSISGVGNLRAVALCHAILGAISSVLLVRLGQRAKFPANASLLAGAIYAVYPAFVFQTPQILSEVLGRTLLLAALLLIFRAVEKGRLAWYAVAGAVLGVTILDKSVFLVCAPFIAAWLLWVAGGSAGRWWLYVGAFLSPLVVVVGSWTVRNYLVSGSLIPVSTNFPITFAHGLTKFCVQTREWYGDRPLLELPENYQEWTQLRYYKGVEEEIELGRDFGSQARDFIRQHPGFFAILTARKALHFWGPFVYNKPVVRLIAFVSMAPILLGGWLFLILSLRRGGNGAKFALLAVLVALPVTLPYALSQADVRYRLGTVEPLWILMASGMAVEIWDWWRRRRQRD